MSSLDIARRVEGVNAEALFQHTAVCARLFPDSGATALRVGGGVAAFVGTEVPISYAVGLGLHGPVHEDDVAQVVEFYTVQGMAPRIDVCPLAHESLLAALRRHHFHLHWFTNVLTRPLDGVAEVEPAADGITIRLARPDEADLWTAVVDEGFSEGPMTEPRRRLGLMLFHREGMRCYLAEHNGVPVGAGSLYMQDRYAGLMATSVLPRYRNRGVHSSLIRTRLRDALAAGCDYAGFFATPGSQSQRNAERHGFRLAYSKATMKGLQP